MSLKSTLSGTGAALVTPFTQNGQIDFNALEKLIHYVINSGVNYVVTLGTTGETPTLDKSEKKDIVAFTTKIVNHRVPIVIGIGGNNTHELVNDLQSFPLSSAVAVLSASPYYSKPSQDGLFQHYKALAENSPLPLLLYNVPGRTGRNLTAATTIKLANEVANIAGIKEAHDDMNQCMEIMKNKPADFLVVSGDDALILPQIALGFDGVISVAANTWPKQFTTMVNLALQGKFAEARAIHFSLLEGYNLLFEENNPAGVKASLFTQGIIENILRLPVTPVSEQLLHKIKQFNAQLA
jgi:4-hydroxy-tetrahydrodipicolinate synthase